MMYTPPCTHFNPTTTMSSPKPAAAQYASMCAKLRAERSRLVDGGVPGCAIVYVVRNDPEDEITKTGPQLGAWFTTIDDAIQTFAIVFMVADAPRRASSACVISSSNQSANSSRPRRTK
jgi:hypothetical protein